MLSQESSQAIFEMGDAELIELKTSMIHCPSCLHYVFKGTILCRCGKHIRPDLEKMRRIKAAFEVLKAPCCRTSAINASGYKHGPNCWQEHNYKAKDAPRGCSKSKRQFSSIWDRRQRDETYREFQMVHEWSDACVRYLDHVAKSDISQKAPHSQRERYNNLLLLVECQRRQASATSATKTRIPRCKEGIG